MQGIVNAETGEDMLWAIVNCLSWWGPRTITHCSWIDFIQEVLNSISSVTVVRAVVFPKLIFWNICKPQYLSVTK